ncbi:hypothetical protein MC885_015401 [Smutsia gigantea]|nr:hypothetical protein MC885_015401 [Smutsia gigantea]
MRCQSYVLHLQQKLISEMQDGPPPGQPPDPPPGTAPFPRQPRRGSTAAHAARLADAQGGSNDSPEDGCSQKLPRCRGDQHPAALRTRRGHASRHFRARGAR